MSITDTGPEDEQSLIEKCKQTSSIGAREALYKHYYSYAMSIGLRYAPTRHDAMMIVNDSFMKAFDKIQSYDLNHPFRGWLRRIIVNTAIDRYRRERKHLENLEDLSMNTLPGNYEDIISQITAGDIMSLLNELPEYHRLVFNLSEIEGFSHREIAEKLGIEVSTSRSCLSRAKARLREQFKIKFGGPHER